MPKFHAKVRGYNSYRTVAQYPSESNTIKNATVRLIGDVLYVPKKKKGMKLIITMARKTAANLNTYHLDLCI